MRICRVQVDSMATPVLALGCDGAYYDVAALETALGREGPSDFHARVFAARAAGLAQLDAALRAGSRPTEARIRAPDALILPPCDEARATLVEVSLHGAGMPAPPGGPAFALASARSLVPCELPLPVGAGPVAVSGGLGAVLGDELSRGTAREAEQAVLGYVLHLAARGSGRPLGCAQLGPALVTPDEIGPLDAVRLELTVAGRHLAAPGPAGAWRRIWEAIAYVSNHLPLRPGDVVVAADVVAGTVELGVEVALTAPRLGRLAGTLVAGPADAPWRAL
ncbi:MAG: fumarylacetoacetate hydrolase family protein [Polyangiaceae bacterium]|nr:fumarylacetoacetate hydrolase family protein [Polyangiaceae bacterium]